MNESTLDRIRKRSAINPELVNRPDITALAQVLNEILLGKQDIYHAGKWTLNNMNGTYAVTMIYGEYWDSAFAFLIQNNESEILFVNDHREAVRGWGITAFTELEHAAVNLAGQQQKPVTFVFPLFSQKDTERFLSMRGYEKFPYSRSLAFGSTGMKRTFLPLK